MWRINQIISQPDILFILHVSGDGKLLLRIFYMFQEDVRQYNLRRKYGEY